MLEREEARFGVSEKAFWCSNVFDRERDMRLKLKKRSRGNVKSFLLVLIGAFDNCNALGSHKLLDRHRLDLESNYKT